MIKQSNRFIFTSILFLLLLFVSGAVYAAEVQLHGKAPMYSGEKINFYAYSDYITKDTVQLESILVKKDGSFTCTLDLKQVRKIFVNLGV